MVKNGKNMIYKDDPPHLQQADELHGMALDVEGDRLVLHLGVAHLHTQGKEKDSHQRGDTKQTRERTNLDDAVEEEVVRKGHGVLAHGLDGVVVL